MSTAKERRLYGNNLKVLNDIKDKKREEDAKNGGVFVLFSPNCQYGQLDGRRVIWLDPP